MGPNVLIGVPFYGSVGGEHLRALERPRLHQGGSHVLHCEGGFSCDNFNWLWCNALNNRMKCGCTNCDWRGSVKGVARYSYCPRCRYSTRQHLTHFCMLHSDVEPLDNWWLETMIVEMEKIKAGVLSIMLPIKDARGVTSTATEDERYTRRITINELGLHSSNDKPLVSPGLWIADLRQDWVHDPELFFTVEDRIVQKPDGQFDCEHTDDGWGWSRKLHAKGVKVVASTCVRAHHWGKAAYPNFGDWGEVERDEPREIWKGTR